MSRRSERKLRRQEKIKSDIRTSAIVSLVGLVFFVAGLVGSFLNQRQLNEYLNSERVITIPAEITYAEIKTEKNEYGDPRDVYDAQVKYSVSGKDYTGKKRFYNKVQKGDTRNIEVYQTSSGEFKIPEFTDRAGLVAGNTIMFAGIGIGAVIFSAGIFSVLRGIRELKS